MAETGRFISLAVKPVPASDRYEANRRHLRRNLVGWSIAAGVAGSTAAGLLGAAGVGSPVQTYSQETPVRNQGLYTGSMFVFGVAASAATTAVAYGVAALLHKRSAGPATAWTIMRPGEVRF